jgi:uncharacterized membrane protein YjjP (DUF1212 family)
MAPRRAQLELLARAGQLLLEYNESTGEIHRALNATARALTGEGCEVAVAYSGVAVTLAGEGPVLTPVREIRYNTAVQTEIHGILEQVRRHELDAETALARLHQVEAETPKHAPWLAIALLGVGAAALAGLLGADAGAVATAGVSTSVGLAARHALHRRHFSVLTMPLAAAIVGSLLGGLAIRLDWTETPGLALIVPCLMLVPGPHLINSLLDLIDNYLPMSLARLWLAAGILLASSLGLLIGVSVTLAELPATRQGFKNDQLNLVTDMLLAGIVTCGFAVYYNAAWRQAGLAIIGGALGHGLRFLALEAGSSLELATFLGGFAVGAVSAWIARSNKTPVAVIAFSGAVTMMPGLQIYSFLRGALQLARLQRDAELPTIAGTLSNGFQAATVVGALGLGVVVAARAVQALPRERNF